MQKHLFTFTFLCLLSIQGYAQNTLNLSMKAGALSGKPAITVPDGNYKSVKNTRDGGSNFSLAFSLPLKKKFRLGAELGMNIFNPAVEGTIAYDGFTEFYNGYYSIKQAYLAIVPEYRIKDALFINAGLGYFNDIAVGFKSGYRVLSGPQEDIRGRTFSRNEALGYFVGLGLCPNITDNLSFLLEARFMGSPSNILRGENIQMGYKAFNFNIGLMYKPKQ